MSGLECACLVCWGATCLVWGCWGSWRCRASGRVSSAGLEWEDATVQQFADVPRICRIILAVYERDLGQPVYADRLAVEHVVKRVGYRETRGLCPPYLIYVDHEARDICLAMRGLNLKSLGDYRVLMNRRKGLQFFDGGYVHGGLLQAARWALTQEYDVIDRLARENTGYTVTFAGHSLGSGIAALMAVLLRRFLEEGNPFAHSGSVGRMGREAPAAPRCFGRGTVRIETDCRGQEGGSASRPKHNEMAANSTVHASRVRSYGFAPARSTSLNLAVRYSEFVHSVILQDDFLPRTSAPIQSILSATCCLPCFLCFKCCGDLVVRKQHRLRDRRRLYVPGRLYHILYMNEFSCMEDEPAVRTAVPAAARFERVVFSRTTVDDHSIVNVERKAVEALKALREQEADYTTLDEDQAQEPASLLMA